MRAGIALGSNLGDRLANLRIARERLQLLGSDLRAAPVFETAPVDCPPGAGPFLNSVIEMETDLPPRALLRALQAIEQDLGRPAIRSRHAPRTLDLDLLYVGDLTIDEPDFQLPHPRMRERRFVLAPLAAIRPDLATADADWTGAPW